MSYYAIYENEGCEGRKLDIQFTQQQVATLSLDELKELSTFARGSRKYSPRVIELSWTARVNRTNADTQDWLLDIIAMKEHDPVRILAKLSPARVDVVYEIPGTNQVAWLDGSPSTYSPKVYRERKNDEETCGNPMPAKVGIQGKAFLTNGFLPDGIEMKETKAFEQVVNDEYGVQIIPRDRVCSYLEKDPETSHLVDVLVSHDEGVGCDFKEEDALDGHVKITQFRYFDRPVVESSKLVAKDHVQNVITDFYKAEKDKMLSALPLKGRDLDRHTVVPKSSFSISMGDIERVAHLYFGRDQVRFCARPFAATTCNVTVRGKDFYLEFGYHGAVKARAKYGPFSVGNVDYRDDTYLLLAVVQSMESFFSVRRTKPVPIFVHHGNFINYGNCYRCFGKVFKTTYPWYVCVKCQKLRATCDMVYEDMVLFRRPLRPLDKLIFLSQKYEGCKSSYFLDLRHYSVVDDGRDYIRLLRLCFDLFQKCRPYSLLWCFGCPALVYRQLIIDLSRICQIRVVSEDGSFKYDEFLGEFPHRGLTPDVSAWFTKVTVPPSFVSSPSIVVWALENDLSANLRGLAASMMSGMTG